MQQKLAADGKVANAKAKHVGAQSSKSSSSARPKEKKQHKAKAQLQSADQSGAAGPGAAPVGELGGQPEGARADADKQAGRLCDADSGVCVVGGKDAGCAMASFDKADIDHTSANNTKLDRWQQLFATIEADSQDQEDFYNW